MWAHCAFSQVVILAPANPKNLILAQSPNKWRYLFEKKISGNFEFYPVIQPNKCYPLAKGKVQFYPVIIQSNLDFILLSRKSTVDQPMCYRISRMLTPTL